MMKWLSFAIIAGLVALNFQNCSPSHVAGEGAFSLSSLYPYFDVKPTYFESVQLTEVTDAGGGVWKYQFVAGLVYIDDPTQDVDVEIQILDEADAILCPRKDLTVNQNTNDIIIDDCQSQHKATKAKISLSAKLHSNTAGTLAPVKTYTFDLN